MSEHGIGTEDDSIRAGFIEPSLEGLAQAIADGVPVLGYCHWTLMDNFEWIFGYGPKLGLHERGSRDVRAHGEAERGSVCRARPNRAAVCELVAPLTFPIRKASR